jgi:hypothetical protein
MTTANNKIISKIQRFEPASTGSSGDCLTGDEIGFETA